MQLIDGRKKKKNVLYLYIRGGLKIVSVKNVLRSKGKKLTVKRDRL